MEKIIIQHKSVHHAKNSGYSQFIDYINDVIQIPSGKNRMSYKIKKLISNNTSQKFGIYDSNSVQKDWELFNRIVFAKNKDRVVHYLNSERDIRFITKINPFFDKTKICASFHYPPSILPKVNSNPKYLKKINGAIAVGINQVDFIKNWLNLENVEFIPHGVNTNFFKPNDSEKTHCEKSILFVGQHLRDFDALNFAIPRLKEKIPSIKINAVLRKDFAHKINITDGVTIYSGIDDDALRKMYQNASLLFLPLKDATACNSILEALACGLPIVSTDIDGNFGYIKNNSGLLLPKNDNFALVDETISLLNNQSKLLEMGNNARTVSLEFEWKKIANDISCFYNKLF